MSYKYRVTTLTLGALLWISNIQYFVAQILVAQQWATPFSLLHNTISDLGNTACGPYRGNIVCSPAYTWMNASFIIVGITILIGAIAFNMSSARSKVTTAGFGLLGLGGIGTILVGLYPENTVSALHVLGASLPFVCGNIALIILGVSLGLPKIARYLTIILGVVGLVFLGFFFTQHYVGLGIGGTERIAAYPQTIWMISYGIYQLSSYRHTRTSLITRGQ